MEKPESYQRSDKEVTKNDSCDVIFFLTRVFGGELFGVFGDVFFSEQGYFFKEIIQIVCMSIPAVIYDAGGHPFFNKIIK